MARLSAHGPTFLRATHRVLARSDLSAAAKILLADLENINAKEKKGHVAPYQATLAERHNVSVRNLRRYIGELETGWLITDEKRGRGRSSIYHLHDSWEVEGADDLVQQWRIEILDGSELSPMSVGGGHARPSEEDRSARLKDRSVPQDGPAASSPIEKNYWRRTTGEETQGEDQPKHSVSGSPPAAVLPERCDCGVLLDLENQLRIHLAHFDDWGPQLGRTSFVIDGGQLHLRPRPAKFLRVQLALIVFWFEKTHQRRFGLSDSRVRYRGSPFTSLDVQRGALLTLEQNPTLAITDLVRAAREGGLIAPTPKFFLKALEDLRDRSGGRRLGTAHLDAQRACRRGLHEMGIEDLQLDVTDDPGSREEVQRPAAKRGQAYSLALYFDEQITALDPMGAGNVAALAKNIASWRGKGVADQVIEMMIDEFVRDFRSYCPHGSVPWQRFVAKRYALMTTVERHFRDEHRWDDDFAEAHALLFGTKGKED